MSSNFENLKRIPNSTLDLAGDVNPANRTRFNPKRPLDLLDISTERFPIAQHGQLLHEFIVEVGKRYPGSVILSPWPFSARVASIPYHNDGQTNDALNRPVNDADFFFLSPINPDEFYRLLRQVWKNSPHNRNIQLAETGSSWTNPYYSAITNLSGENIVATEIHHIPGDPEETVEKTKRHYFPYYNSRFGHPVLHVQFESDQPNYSIWQPYQTQPATNQVRIYEPEYQASTPRVLLTGLRYLLWACRASVICNTPATLDPHEVGVIGTGVKRFLTQIDSPQQEWDVISRFNSCQHLARTLSENISNPDNFNQSSDFMLDVLEELYGEWYTELPDHLLGKLLNLKHTGSRYDHLFVKHKYNPLEWFNSKARELGYPYR